MERRSQRLPTHTAAVFLAAFALCGIARGQTVGEITRIDPPEAGFFSKQLVVRGVAIKAHADTSDAAIEEAARRIDRQLSRAPGMADNLRKFGAEMHIIGKDQQTTDLPEYRHLKGKPFDGKLTIDERGRGYGGLPASCAEENLLLLPSDRFREHRDICIHEFAHTILGYGVSREAREKVEAQFRKSMAADKWKTAYAASNPHEFFAELTMWYFGSRGDYGKITPAPSRGATWLKAYDPEAYELLDAIYSGRIDPGKVEVADLAPLGPDAEGQIRSKSNQPTTQVLFINRTDQPVERFWLDFEGKRKSYGTVAPGTMASGDTFVTHTWLMEGPGGKFLGIYVLDRAVGRIVIDSSTAAEVLKAPAQAAASAAPAQPAPGGDVAARRAACVVGAIRWDAWHGERGGPGKVVEKTLGPKHWHHRLPFYGREVSDTKVEARADSQAVMDQEIAYAHAAGIDYWAFVTYPPEDPMSLGLRLYLSSRHKADIRFCLSLQGGWLARGGPADWPNKVAEYVGYFKDPCYQRVAGGRPLLYIFVADQMVGPGKFESWDAARRALDELRRAAAAAGTAAPYLVIQGFWPPNDRETIQKLGADAISAYALSGGSKEGRPYAALARQARDFWDRGRQTGAKVVPIASAGWDRRPRVENPVPWEDGPGNADFFLAPTPQELAASVREAVEWNAAHPDAAEANAVILYAWNELDEGGWIVPTLSEGTARLDAIGEALRALRAAPPQAK